jgi:hypothetical protein
MRRLLVRGNPDWPPFEVLPVTGKWLCQSSAVVDSACHYSTGEMISEFETVVVAYPVLVHTDVVFPLPAEYPGQLTQVAAPQETCI